MHTTQDILALVPGPALDQAVHSYVMAGTGESPAYSTSEIEGIRLLDRLGLYVGRVAVTHPRFDATRPYAAGVLSFDAATGGDVSRLRVTAATRMAALCKAALLVVLQPAKLDKQVAAQSSAEKAKELAARVGTPGARSVALGKAAAESARARREEAKALRDASAARKASKLAKKLGHTAPAAAVAPQRPVRTGPAQPGTGAAHRRELPPMPTRPKEFVEPQKIHTGGGERGGAAPV